MDASCRRIATVMVRRLPVLLYRGLVLQIANRQVVATANARTTCFVIETCDVNVLRYVNANCGLIIRLGVNQYDRFL